MKRRKLPLESANWWPMPAALKHRSERMGADQLAIWDFNRKLKADELRVQLRDAKASRELPASAWKGFYVCPLVEAVPSSPGRFRLGAIGMTVWSRKLGGRIPWHWFFVWRPDYENIFDGKAKSMTKPRRSAEEEQAKQGAPLKHDWIKITTEAAFREADATKKQRDRSDLAEARSMRRWCVGHLKKRPGLTDLREIVKTVRGRFRRPE